MNKKWFCLIAALSLIAGCGPKEKVVKVAVALPLTGDIASLGQGLERACQLALEEANKAQRFKDFKVEMESFDDRSDPKQAVDVANRIVSDPAFAVVIGHFNSGCSIPASKVYASNHLPMISPAASNPQLTLQQLDPSWHYPKSIFRVNTTDDVQGPYAANFAINKLGLKKAAIIHDKTAYGQGVATEFRKGFEEKGGRVLSFDGISVQDKDFNALLTRIHDEKPDVIYFGGDFSGGGLVVRQARGLGEKATFILSEANFDPEFLRVAGPAAEGAYVTFLGAPTELAPNAKAFVKAYHERYPGQEIKAYDGYGYEAMNIALEMIAKDGGDRDKIIADLPHIDYHGILGETRFDEKGDTLNHQITIFRVKDGKFEPVK